MNNWNSPNKDASGETQVKNNFMLTAWSKVLHEIGCTFNNVRIKEGDEWKAAFRTNCGLFEPLIMYFGLTNSPATFQTMMDEIFEDLISEGVVVVYLDDILIFTETLDEHRRITRRALELLEKHKLYLRADKCEFEKTTVEYLGVIISHNSVAMDPVLYCPPQDLIRTAQNCSELIRF